jgi:hypothetical protein
MIVTRATTLLQRYSHGSETMVAKSGTGRCLHLVLVLCGIAVFVAAFFFRNVDDSDGLLVSAGVDDGAGPDPSPAPTPEPTEAPFVMDAWEFVKYHPSPVELKWWNGIDKYKQDPCHYTWNEFRRELYKVIEQSKPDLATDYLRNYTKVTDLPATLKDAILPNMSALLAHKEIYSRFEYRNKRTGQRHFSPIEPLAGPLRHPYICGTGKIHDPDVIRKDWLVIDPWIPHVYRAKGKPRYFDAGASGWVGESSGSSQQWFWALYGRMAVHFDSFHCWEASKWDRKTYFDQIPPELWPKYNFYNFPATTDPKDEHCPIFELNKTHSPGDFVVFKLDIDNTPVEEALVEALLKHPEQLLKIDEFFWEHHVFMPTMVFAWGRQDKDQKYTIEYLKRMREIGVRAHSWV